MLDDRGQSLHSLVSLDEHLFQLSDGQPFLLRVLFAVFGRGCSVCGGGLQCALRAGGRPEEGTGPRSRHGGAWGGVGTLQVCHWWQ